MDRLHRIEFRIHPQEFHGNATLAWDVVNLYVDGVLLQDLARPAERPFAEADGHPEPAGQYVGLDAEAGIRWPSRHFLGQPGSVDLEDGGDPYLLGCVRGIASRRPLVARIEATVTWRACATRGARGGPLRAGPARVRPRAVRAGAHPLELIRAGFRPWPGPEPRLGFSSRPPRSRPESRRPPPGGRWA